MRISEAQQHFSAFGAGKLPEFELRNFIRKSVSQEPELSSALIALTDAYRRANLIDAQLQTTINADIAAVTTPTNLTKVRTASPTNLTKVRSPAAAEGPSIGWMDDVSAANSTGPGWQQTGPLATGHRGTMPTGPTPPTAATAGSSWDVSEGLSEVGASLYPGSVIRDRFVLVEELGRGGMGVVYKAFDRSRGDMKDRYVALKVLNEEFKRHPLAVKALQREARKAQKLAHPNIVAVHDFDRDGGNVYMVMECLSGRSLDQVLREDGQGGIPPGPAMQIIGCLASALSYAHAQDIVHCDFKPSNAFLCNDGKVKVLDFGIARAAPSEAVKGDATLFDAGQLGAISPAYASMELLQRDQPDVRDDVYSFACVAYELLSGCHPYQRLDAAKAFAMGLQPRPIRRLTRSQWRALKQGLAFRRKDRCPSIDALARELSAAPNRTMLWVGAGVAAGVLAVGSAVLVLKRPDVGQWLTQLTSKWHRQDASAHADSVAPTTPSREEPAATPAARPADDHSPSAAPGADNPATDTGSTALAGLVANPEATQQWARDLDEALNRRLAVVSPGDPEVVHARRTAVTTFVTAATQARARQQLDLASALLEVAKSFDKNAPEIVPESVAIQRDRLAKTAGSATPDSSSAAANGSPKEPVSGSGPAPAQSDGKSSAEKQANVEILHEQFETAAETGDIGGATNIAKTLKRVSPNSNYVTQEVPRILALSYVKLAKSQFAGGQVIESLHTLEDGRSKFPKSLDLHDLHVRYVAASNSYDRLRFAVTLNVNDWKGFLSELKDSEGDEYDTAAQMFAQTLADRIADQRAAGRETVANQLLESGKQIFPSFGGILDHGRAGTLPDEPIAISDP